MEIAGFIYDREKDIFYSDMNAWQRQYGYCRLYDEATVLMNMIIDCEPIYFDYDGKHWLIEFWKGQYGMATGCEVGIYNTAEPELNIPGMALYDSAPEKDMLNIHVKLYKDDKVLFWRTGRHWWLTGFVLAEYSEPQELWVKISILLKDKAMLAAFLAAMKEAGYSDRELRVSGNTVSFIFEQPHTAQPLMRTKEISYIVQRKNKYLCDKFNELAGDENKDTLSKIEAIKKLDPALYDEISYIGGIEKILDKYKMLVKFLEG